MRRALREKKSRFFGTKQILTTLNQPAHAVVHDLDIAPKAGYGFRAYRNAVMNHTSSGNFQTVSMNAEDYDDGVYNTTTDVFTVPLGMPGLWYLEGRIEFADSSAGGTKLELQFLKNGATVIDNVQVPTAAVAVSLSLSTVVKLAGGDTVEMQAKQSTGGALQYNGTTSATKRFAAAYFGPRPS